MPGYCVCWGTSAGSEERCACARGQGDRCGGGGGADERASGGLQGGVSDAQVRGRCATRKMLASVCAVRVACRAIFVRHAAKASTLVNPDALGMLEKYRDIVEAVGVKTGAGYYFLL